jgi:hypothetical protein
MHRLSDVVQMPPLPALTEEETRSDPQRAEKMRIRRLRMTIHRQVGARRASGIRRDKVALLSDASSVRERRLQGPPLSYHSEGLRYCVPL